MDTPDIWIYIGSGSTSKVFRRAPPGQAEVAIKFLNADQESLNQGLQECFAHGVIKEHDSIISLIGNGSQNWEDTERNYLIYELMATDLQTHMREYAYEGMIPCNIWNVEIKHIMWKLCSALAACHRLGFVHRDIKPENILIKNNDVKLADFGKSIQCVGDPFIPNNQTVFQLPYRAPELLLGAPRYSSAVDIWALGCVFAQMSRGALLFDGKGEYEMLKKIFRLLGIPDESSWPGVSQLLGDWGTLDWQPKSINRVVESLDDLGPDLLQRMLCLNPARRITAEEALHHPYFKDRLQL